jgi:hypothetical protein
VSKLGLLGVACCAVLHPDSVQHCTSEPEQQLETQLFVLSKPPKEAQPTEELGLIGCLAFIGCCWVACAGLGLSAAARKAAEVFALVWAGSQVRATAKHAERISCQEC